MPNPHEEAAGTVASEQRTSDRAEQLSGTTEEKRLTPDQQQMVEQNIPLVHHIVSRVTERFPASHSRDDLVQAGLMGLIEATRRFDPELGFSFSTFAGRRIEGAILDSLRAADWASRSVRRGERRLHEVEAELTATLGRRPTDLEVCQIMELDVEQVHGLRSDLARASVDSLDRRVAGASDAPTVAESAIPAQQGSSLTQDLEHRELVGYLRDGVRLLPERHRIVIIGHFVEGRSMTELGSFLGVTQSRASQLKQEALTLLRKGLDANLGDTEPSEKPTRTQESYNQAMSKASGWRERLDSKADLAPA